MTVSTKTRHPPVRRAAGGRPPATTRRSGAKTRSYPAGPVAGEPDRRSSAHPDPRRRLVALFVVFVLAFSALVIRLVDVQVLSNRRYAVFGESQRLRSVVLPAERGAILDRNGAELAMSTRGKTVWADPRSVRDPMVAARALAPVLGVEEAVLRERLSANAGFVYLARKVSEEAAKKVEELDVAGVSLLEEPSRYMPGGGLAASLLGQVGIDSQGLAGLELKYDKELTGRSGEMLVERDPNGHVIPAGVRQLRPPARGANLVLTIDRSMQYEAERALSERIVASRAKGGIAIVMDPKSGEILAMASLAAHKTGPPASTPDNMAVTKVYEPGSVNKVVTVAAALEEKLVDPAKRMYVPDNIKVADTKFTDAEPHVPQSWSVSDIVANSSNVGTIMIAQRLGKSRIDRYLKAFGLARRTALRFPGESGGIIPDVDDWSGTSIGTLPIGQGVAVTALQMIGAYNTIANGGVYVAPTLVKSVIDAKGKVHRAPEPERQRVVSEATAKAVTSMLVAAVDGGTGTAARIEGYSVAGKTGTARKPDEKRAGYKEGAYIASFAGFLPAESPELSMIVVLDEPTPYFGGVVSAPVFAQIASVGVRLLRIPPSGVAEGASIGRVIGMAPEHQGPDPERPVVGTAPAKRAPTLPASVRRPGGSGPAGAGP